mmetsp:Transcript_9574/g.27982  ORF Transcript_9574/g.27982 Transcript_9574/m.27982 type:complete len:244 (+) Transcript_9574:918-1649(+)
MVLEVARLAGGHVAAEEGYMLSVARAPHVVHGKVGPLRQPLHAVERPVYRAAQCPAVLLRVRGQLAIGIVPDIMPREDTRLAQRRAAGVGCPRAHVAEPARRIGLGQRVLPLVVLVHEVALGDQALLNGQSECRFTQWVAELALLEPKLRPERCGVRICEVRVVLVSVCQIRAMLLHPSDGMPPEGLDALIVREALANALEEELEGFLVDCPREGGGHSEVGHGEVHVQRRLRELEDRVEYAR